MLPPLFLRSWLTSHGVKELRRSQSIAWKAASVRPRLIARALRPTAFQRSNFSNTILENEVTKAALKAEATGSKGFE